MLIPVFIYARLLNILNKIIVYRYRLGAVVIFYVVAIFSGC